MSKSNAHQKRVASVATQVRQAAQRKQLVKIYHGSSNSTRMPDFHNRVVIDTSDLSHIIEINSKQKYVLVEPSIQMDELVAATLKHGLVPPVVMEFPGISVGGGIQGGAAESSSFKYGAFHETALEYELVLGDGSVVIASREQRPDLFWGSACSYGSLGIITLVKLRLVPAMPFVKLTYHRTNGREEVLALIDAKVHHKDVDFIDGILFSPHSGVVMTGEFAAAAETLPVTFSKKNDDWFYLHAKKMIHDNHAHEEYIPLKDYLFRYDRGAFWVGRLAFAHIKLPFNQLTRRWFDRALHTRSLYRFVHETDLSQRFFIQDIFMPAENIAGFIDYISRATGIWPLWLLPMRPSREKLDIFGLSFSKSDYIMNVGIWGKPKTKSYEAFVKLNRKVEDKLPGLHARKTLYAHSYYPPETFWQIYDQRTYNTLRNKYHARGVFDNIYDKVTVRAQYKAPLGKALWRQVGRKFFG